MSAATDGEVLASHRPRHPVGWLLAFALLVVASGVTGGYAKYGLLVRPPSLPAAIDAVAYSSIAVLPIAACLSFPSPADADRVAAHAALAVVGLGHGGAALLAAVSGVLLPFEPPYRSVANPLAVPALADLHGATATVRDGLAT